MVKLESDEQFSTLEALNSPSFRPFFFTVSVGERFINPFFRLLDSSGKSAEMS
jgi:hypothetical protein